jgi:hypothetical protein
MLSDALAGDEARLIAKLQAIEALFCRGRERR